MVDARPTTTCLPPAEDPTGGPEVPGTLVCTGLLAVLDPSHASAVHAVATRRTAGIRAAMTTGDHAATATTATVQVGILRDGADDDVLTPRGPNGVRVGTSDPPGPSARPAAWTT